MAAVLAPLSVYLMPLRLPVKPRCYLTNYAKVAAAVCSPADNSNKRKAKNDWHLYDRNGCGTSRYSPGKRHVKSWHPQRRTAHQKDETGNRAARRGYPGGLPARHLLLHGHSRQMQRLLSPGYRTNPFGRHDLELAMNITHLLHIPAGVVINKSYAATGDNNIKALCESRRIPVLAKISPTIFPLLSNTPPATYRMNFKPLPPLSGVNSTPKGVPGV